MGSLVVLNLYTIEFSHLRRTNFDKSNKSNASKASSFGRGIPQAAEYPVTIYLYASHIICVVTTVVVLTMR